MTALSTATTTVAPPDMVDGVIPLLDVGPFLAGEAGAHERLGAQLRFAFEHVGFYYLRGHGVPQSLIDATFSAAARFHAQPLEQKLAVQVNEHNIGYLPMGGNAGRGTSFSGRKPSRNEAYFLRRERTPDDPDVIANKRFRGLNQWPTDLPGFRETALAYMTTMESLGKRLVPLYATALGLPPEWFAEAFAQPNLILRLSHYPPQSAYAADEFSLVPHTDSGFMTLLAPSKVPGLSIQLPHGQWFAAPTIEGTFIVNGGDILHRWTNERFLSTPHRVINASGTARYAIPFFFDPHPDTMIECLPTCCSQDNPPKYPAIRLDDYLLWFAAKSYAHLADAPALPTTLVAPGTRAVQRW
jgi:isopenicillin N synthase-like dioxygenase